MAASEITSERLALHYSLNNPDSLVLVLSPSLRQSGELFKKIMVNLNHYRNLGHYIPSETETALTLTLTNGARIVSLPSQESTIRCYSGVDLLLIDEAALVPESVIMASLPMLAVNEKGRLIAMGTPHGKRGWFYEAFTNGGDLWKRYTIKAEQCPRISKAFLAEQKANMPDYWFQQEFCCAWMESDTTLFRADIIERAIRDFDELEIDLGDDTAPDLEPSQFINDFDLKGGLERMVNDPNWWMPQDGSLSTWQDEHNKVFNPKKYEAPKETQWLNYYVGVDLGRVRDYSAAAIIDFKYAPSGKRFHYVKYLQRFPLNTTYTKIAEMLAGIDTQLRAYAKGAGKEADITWAVDSTGVGDGVAEIIQSKMTLADVYRVYLTGGINAAIDYENRQIKLPKNQMVSCLLGCFDSDRIFLSKRSRELNAMREELQNFQSKISEDAGRESFNAKIGSHDDLLCALGIAAWCGEQSGEPIQIW